MQKECVRLIIQCAEQLSRGLRTLMRAVKIKTANEGQSQTET